MDSERINVERAPTDAPRPFLAETLQALSSGDHLLVPSLASLARSPGEFERIVQMLRVRGVELWVAGHRYDSLGQSEVGELFLTMTADLQAEAETEAEAEQGKRKAETRSGTRGPRPKLTAVEKLQLRQEYDAGGRLEELQAKWGLSRATVFRALGPTVLRRHAN